MNEAKVAGHDLPSRGTLRRLARDPAGNTLAMMAIALIPISALAGSAIDTARLYLVKSRLQQACDAGVLAGRKFMNETSGTTLDAEATKQAKAFFDNNMNANWMRTAPSVFTPTRTTENRVAGVASVQVPMTIMKMFGAADVTLTTTCEARFDVADTDVMFVLDTTGSMACTPSDSDYACGRYSGVSLTYTRPGSTADVTPGYVGSTGYSVTEKSGSRIAALRTAVVDFFDTMAAAKQPTTRVRYGFVPYTSTVNVGASVRAMSASYIVGGNGSGDVAPYQTRYVTGDYTISRSVTNANNGKSSANCGVGFTPVRTPTPVGTFFTNGTATLTAQEWDGSRNVRACQDITRTLGPVWTYAQRDVDVSAYVSNASVADPTKVVPASTAWLGCIEEPDASSSGSYSFDIGNLPPNLNPDLVPNGATRWRPMWPEVVYQRSYDNATTNGDNDSAAPWMGNPARQRLGNVSCGKPAQRLADLSREQVQNYVNAVDFVPLGGTYHDVGMLWATRLLSRTGVFASDNAAQNGRGRPKRVIVFLTDGAMSPSAYLYGLYGMEYWDNRVANGDIDDLKAYHNARFLALCDKAKAMDIDVWTVALGTDSTPELTSCATSTDQALDTTSGTGLSETFRKIAKAVAMLRVSK